MIKLFYNLKYKTANLGSGSQARFKEMQKMKRKKQLGVLLLAAIVLIPILIFIGNVQPDVENPESSKVVFYVS
jgi:hypothetical protein